jgi:hypothetical protein
MRIDQKKICFKYEEEKTFDRFSTDNAAKDGKCNKCKECQRQWRKDNIERIRPQRTKYTEKNLEKAIFASAKARAKKNNLEFSIKLEDIVIPSKCPVLGLELKRSSGGRTPGSPSIDRIDNLKGYTKSNISIISWRANTVKWNASIEELESILNYMKENQNELTIL